MNERADQLVDEYGACGEASRFFAEVSRDAVIAAVTNAGANKLLKPRILDNRYIGRGSRLLGRARYGNKGLLNSGPLRLGWGWNGSDDVLRMSWAPRGGGSWWNHIDILF